MQPKGGSSRPRQLDTFPCPACGADLLVGALACPECHADDETGWSDDAMYDGLDLPDAQADDEQDRSPRSRRRLWQIIVAALLAAVMFLVLTGVG